MLFLRTAGMLHAASIALKDTVIYHLSHLHCLLLLQLTIYPLCSCTPNCDNAAACEQQHLPQDEMLGCKCNIFLAAAALMLLLPAGQARIDRWVSDVALLLQLVWAFCPACH